MKSYKNGTNLLERRVAALLTSSIAEDGKLKSDADLDHLTWVTRRRQTMAINFFIPGNIYMVIAIC